MATAATPKMTTRRATGTTLKPSRKARDAAEAELSDDTEARPQKKTRKPKPRGKNVNANIENQPVGDAASEVQFTTLPTNRTSKRAPNVIKLTAKTDGIPRADKVAARAQVVAGQRKPAGTPAPPKRKLTAEAAAELVKMRNPFVSPAQVIPSRYKQQGAATAPESSHLQTPAPSSRSASRQPAAGTVPAQGHVRPPPPRARGPSAAATPRPEVHVARQASLQPAIEHSQRSLSPVDDRNEEDWPLREDVVRYAVSSVTHADVVGKVPRIDKGYHVAALDDVDDEFTDEGEHFEDYVSNPRARATALAYSSELTAAIPQDYDYEAEEQAEMEEDPDADLESSTAPEDHVHRELGPQDDRRYYEYDDEEVEADNQDHHPQRHLQRTITASRNADDDDLANDTDVPVAKHRAVSDDKKVGVRDYEGPAQEILERAITIFKTRVTAENAYPDKLQDRTWAKAAWARATRELDIKMKHDGRAIELIARNAWGLRGEIKGYARNFVPGEYGFKQVLSTDADGIARNVELAQQLLGSNAFKYKDPATRLGLFESDIIQTIINKVYYKNPSDDGVIHDDVYRPFPVRGVALVLTAVQNAIQEWSTGLHQSVKFDELVYENEYKVHLQDLLAFEEDSQELKIVSAICLKLSQYGRDHAKAPLTQHRGPSGGLSSDDLARAVAAYRLKLQNA